MSQERFEALYSNLQSIYKCKTAINNAITRKGESTTGMDFNDYTQAISNLNGKISTIPSNLVVDTVENIADRMDTDGIVFITNTNNNLQSIAYYNVTENTFDYTNKYGLSTNKQQVFSGTFLGDTMNVEEGALGTQFVALTEEITDEFKIRINSVDRLSYINLDPNVTDLSSAFDNQSNFIWIPNFDTSNVTNMYRMFYNCQSLTSVPNFNTINVTNMWYMFSDCQSLTSISNFDTRNVTYMYYMFYNCYNLISIPNFDTSNVISMGGMFGHCNNLTSVPNFDTSNVTAMASMFLNCENLTSVPNYNTSKVTNMTRMFMNCNNLVTVPNFDTSNVKRMWHMFDNCYNLTSVPNFNTSKVNDMEDMFRECHNLISVPNFDNSKIKYMSNMFLNCNNLSSESYANIANMLPLAVNLTNQYVSNIGLNISNFTNDQINILNNKGYIDAVLPSPIQNYYEIQWE